MSDNLTLEVRMCLSYIIDVEREDFCDNPSSEHIFYLAFKLKHGIDAANKLLEECIDFNNAKR